MAEEFKIYVDRLKGGQVEKIRERVSADFIELGDNELLFDSEVAFVGEAYLAEDELIIHLMMETEVQVPCSICQKMVRLPLKVSDFYHAVPLDKVKTAVYDMQEWVRETLILNAPELAECQGQCPEREALKKYFSEGENDDGHKPFANIQFNNPQ